MNKVELIGRITMDPELRYSQGSGIASIRFTLAVDRKYKNKDGEKEADFITVVCWRKTAEAVANYTKKGQRIGVIGSIQVRKYQTADGTNRYATEVVAEEIEFLERKAQNTQGEPIPGGFEAVEDDRDIPF